MEETKKKRRGPKPRPVATDEPTSSMLPGGFSVGLPAPVREPRRSTFSLRLVDEMRARLQAAADKKHRPLSEEIEHRLANSLDDDERFGDLESQMFGRMVGETIRFAQKTLTGDNEEWWRTAENRAKVREAIIDAIEAQLNRSDRWMRPPTELEAQINKWIAAIPETQFKPNFAEAVLELIRRGLEKAANGRKNGLREAEAEERQGR